VAVATSGQTLDELQETLERMVLSRPTVGEAACALIEAEDARAAVELANELAAEHLELIGADVEALAAKVRTAGALFVGVGSATAFGDYVGGSNHVLPTGGAARFASGLSARHFRRRMQEVRIGEQAAAKLAAAGAPIARAEGFAVHAESMEARMRENREL
jgi:histidinol dehydrogenase